MFFPTKCKICNCTLKAFSFSWKEKRSCLNKNCGSYELNVSKHSVKESFWIKDNVYVGIIFENNEYKTVVKITHNDNLKSTVFNYCIDSNYQNVCKIVNKVLILI